MKGEISHICWQMSAIKFTQEAEVRILGQPSKVVKTLSKKQANEDDYGQNIMYSSMKMKKNETCGNNSRNAGRENKL
jgi:hypothetical protein